MESVFMSWYYLENSVMEDTRNGLEGEKPYTEQKYVYKNIVLRFHIIRLKLKISSIDKIKSHTCTIGYFIPLWLIFTSAIELIVFFRIVYIHTCELGIISLDYGLVLTERQVVIQSGAFCYKSPWNQVFLSWLSVVPSLDLWLKKQYRMN